jgi:sugar phosphate isomerase/epimerase
VISEDPYIGGSAEKLRQPCAYLVSKGSGMRVNIEFGYFNSGCHTIDQANAILDIVDHPLAAALIDVLHVFRSGDSPEVVTAIPRGRISYSQICDRWKHGPDVNDEAAIRRRLSRIVH